MERNQRRQEREGREDREENGKKEREGKKWRRGGRRESSSPACIWLHNCSTGFETGSAQKKSASKQQCYTHFATTEPTLTAKYKNTGYSDNLCQHRSTQRWTYKEKREKKLSLNLKHKKDPTVFHINMRLQEHNENKKTWMKTLLLVKSKWHQNILKYR